jgi:drug/metabolite transporter superfamily protein YnfA
MPLWFTLPVVLLLGASSWISTLDPTGAPGANFLLWGGTAIAASLVVLRLLRIA